MYLTILYFILYSYGTKIPSKVLGERLASYVHYFTLHGSLRPFGTSALVASYDPETKQHSLQMVEPSGVAYTYYGCAAGKGRQPARTELEKLDVHKTETSIDVREGVKQLARIIHLLHEEGKDKPFELEMSWVCEESNWEHKGVPRDYIKEAVEWAKKDIEEEEEFERKERLRKSKRDMEKLLGGINTQLMSDLALATEAAYFSVNLFPTSYYNPLEGGTYEDALQLIDAELPDNKAGRRVNYTQQKLHEEMIQSQYDN